MQILAFGDEHAPPNKEYRVLARKYRPQTFKEMIGQEVLVQTFNNAVNSNRLAHAFILTGIRGVGKTTTARIIARSLNCIGREGNGNITMEPCGICTHCTAIASDRHQDILEMDAASHTGVNDVREIIENSKYKPVSARFKIFIIDEVHMLSTSAFNALLKTLEEPPAHVKFIFATTEIRKIPLTILSRCQRFDLKRVQIEDLIKHFSHILNIEGFTAEPNALKLIAINAEGSVRDGLSLLDQTLSHSEGKITEKAVREMLGLSDVQKVYDLFETLAKGEITEALTIVKSLYEHGVDSVLLIHDLLTICHNITKLKHSPTLNLPELELERSKKLAGDLSIPQLARIWQHLLKGIEELKSSFSQFASLEMLLIRIAYTSTLPSPEDVLKRLKGKSEKRDTVLKSNVPQSDTKNHTSNILNHPSIIDDKIATKKTDNLQTFEDIVRLCFNADEMMLYHHLKNDVSFVKLEDNRLTLKLLPGGPREINTQLQAALEKITNQNWQIIFTTNSANNETLAQQERKSELLDLEAVKKHPSVQNVLNSFTDMEIADIKIKKIA